MPDYEISLMVVVTADTIEEAVEEGRSDLAHWARRGHLNVTEMSTGERWGAGPDGITPLPSTAVLADLDLGTDVEIGHHRRLAARELNIELPDGKEN